MSRIGRRHTQINRNRIISLHPHQLELIGVDVGDDVITYVDKGKIVIEKKKG